MEAVDILTNARDFNWVKARQDCTVQAAFGCFRHEVRNAIDERNQLFPDHEKKHGTKFFSVVGFKKGDDYRPDVFKVFRHDNAGGQVTFQLSLEKGCIQVTRELECKDSFRITLALGDDGECRFQIDGSGEYLRWQVVRRALHKLLFARTNS